MDLGPPVSLKVTCSSNSRDFLGGGVLNVRVGGKLPQLEIAVPTDPPWHRAELTCKLHVLGQSSRGYAPLAAVPLVLQDEVHFVGRTAPVWTEHDDVTWRRHQAAPWRP